MSIVASCWFRICALALLGGAAGVAWAQAAAPSAMGTFFPGPESLKARAAGAAVAPHAISFPAAASTAAATEVEASAAVGQPGTLPLWSYNALSSRDGQHHRGVAVGTDPFNNPGTADVPVRIVPVRFVLHTVATSFDASTFLFTTQSAHYTLDASRPDVACLGRSNNVPATLLRQSPIFVPSNFSFGTTALGDVQYIDAHQRASFYHANPSVPGNYHLVLAPVQVGEAVTIDVPDYAGMAIDPNLAQVFAAAFGFDFCGLNAIVDIAWFDNYLNDQLLPRLAQSGVSPASLPYFLVYNTWMASPVTYFGSCCVGGYHSAGFAGSAPALPTQTYAVANFDATGIFGPGAQDTAIAAHEIGEWANDPYGINLVPPWGGTGQVQGCQNNLEVGDPLTGSIMPPVTMPNGYTYHLQELAFYSWFLGAPSVGANGWYSGNGSFATDAGTPCAYY